MGTGAAAPPGVAAAGAATLGEFFLRWCRFLRWRLGRLTATAWPILGPCFRAGRSGPLFAERPVPCARTLPHSAASSTSARNRPQTTRLK